MIRVGPPDFRARSLLRTRASPWRASAADHDAPLCFDIVVRRRSTIVRASPSSDAAARRRGKQPAGASAGGVCIRFRPGGGGWPSQVESLPERDAELQQRLALQVRLDPLCDQLGTRLCREMRET